MSSPEAVVRPGKLDQWLDRLILSSALMLLVGVLAVIQPARANAADLQGYHEYGITYLSPSGPITGVRSRHTSVAPVLHSTTACLGLNQTEWIFFAAPVDKYAELGTSWGCSGQAYWYWDMIQDSNSEESDAGGLPASGAADDLFTIQRDPVEPTTWDASVNGRIVHTFKLGQVVSAAYAELGVESRLSDATLPPTAFTQVQVQTGSGWSQQVVPHSSEADSGFQVQPTGGDDFTVTAGSPLGATWHPISPVRIADTRVGLGFPPGPYTGLNLNGGALTAAGTGEVPASATAVMVDVTVTRATKPTSVNVGVPVYSTARNDETVISARPGQTTTSLVLVDLAEGNDLQATVSHGTAAVIIDLVGYASPPLPPAYAQPLGDRLQPQVSHTLLAGPQPGAAPKVLSLPIAPVGGVEPDAVLLSVSASRPGQTGFLAVGPVPDPTRPPTTALTVDRGQAVITQILAPVVDGQVQLVEHTGGLGDLQVDQTGALLPVATWQTTAPLFHGAQIQRMFDTRQLGQAPVPAGGTLTRHVTASEPTNAIPTTEVPPTGVTAVWMSLTATGAATPTTITVPSPADPAVQVPILQVPAGGAVSGLALIPLDAAGNITLRSTSAAVQLIGDLEGYQGTSPTG